MVVPNLGDKARGWPTWTRWASQVIRLLKKGQPSILQRLWLTQPVPRAAPGATNMNVHYCLAQFHCDLEMIFQRKLTEGRLLGTAPIEQKLLLNTHRESMLQALARHQ